MSESPLRILHILNSVRETGNGIINTAMDLAWGEASRGHTVGVVSGGGAPLRPTGRAGWTAELSSGSKPTVSPAGLVQVMVPLAITAFFISSTSSLRTA